MWVAIRLDTRRAVVGRWIRVLAPPGRVLEDRRAVEWVDVLASLQVDLDLGHEALSVDLARKRPLPLPAAVVPPPGEPGHLAVPVALLDAGHVKPPG
jgi:hypothetical protein